MWNNSIVLGTIQAIGLGERIDAQNLLHGVTQDFSVSSDLKALYKSVIIIIIIIIIIIEILFSLFLCLWRIVFMLTVMQRADSVCSFFILTVLDQANISRQSLNWS